MKYFWIYVWSFCLGINSYLAIWAGAVLNAFIAILCLFAVVLEWRFRP